MVPSQYSAVKHATIAAGTKKCTKMHCSDKLINADQQKDEIVKWTSQSDRAFENTQDRYKFHIFLIFLQLVMNFQSSSFKNKNTD